MKFVGMLRIKDSEPWIKDVLKSIYDLCERIYVMDDHSTDRTAEICRSFDSEQVSVFDSPFEGLDESRDKNWLYDKIIADYPPGEHGYTWPDWVVCIDGDEVLEEGGQELIRETCEATKHNALSLRIIYLWDRPDQMRVDGVYGNFRRPSLFRLINPAFRFQTTEWNGNLHCSSIPQELIAGFGSCEAALLHYGYMERERRLAKHGWYNEVDPCNYAEDCYRHMIIGDRDDLPPETRRKWAGPLKLKERT